MSANHPVSSFFSTKTSGKFYKKFKQNLMNESKTHTNKGKLSDGVSVLVSSPLLVEGKEEERWKVWRLYKCPACGHEIYTNNEKEKALLHMENLQPAFKLPLDASGYSFAFLPSANTEGNEVCLSEEHLSELDSKFNDFIEREQQAMEERIREYALRQRQLFSEFQQRALVERNILLYKLPERRQPELKPLQELERKPETTVSATTSVPAKNFVSMSSMRLIKDQIAVSASGEREISKGVESDPPKTESRPMPATQLEEQGRLSPQKVNEGHQSQAMVIPMPSNSVSIKPRPGGFVKAKKQRSQEPALFDFDEESLGSEQSDNDMEEPDNEADEVNVESVRDDVKQPAFPYASSLPVMISNPYLNKPQKEKEKEKFVEPHVLSADKNKELAVLMDRPSASWRPATTWAGNI